MYDYNNVYMSVYILLFDCYITTHVYSIGEDSLIRV